MLVGQYRYPTEQYSWEIPEGGAEAGETTSAAARRELAEEAGVIAHDWTELGPPIQVSNCISAEMGYLYLARDLEETTPNPDGTEVLEVAHIGLDECWRWVADGRISDSLTLLALHRYAAWSRRA